MKNKKMLIILLFSLLIISLIIFFQFKVKTTNSSSAPNKSPSLLGHQIELSQDVILTLGANNYELLGKSEEKKEKATDVTYTYKVTNNHEASGELELVIREVDNGDSFIFSKFTRQSTEDIVVPLYFSFHGQHTPDLFPIGEPIDQEHDNVFGIDHTTNVKGLFTIGAYQAIISQNYISTELEEIYENGNKSVLRELVNEDDNIEWVDTKEDTQLVLKLRTTDQNQISENWVLLSKESLAYSEDSIQTYKEMTNEKFISSPKWLVADGNYTKLPWSVEPSTKLGYGRNLVALQGNLFLELLETYDERFFYDMFIHSLNSIIDYNHGGKLWETEYTSSWLDGEYGIKAPYLDTRHNENVALFLTKAGEYLNDEKLKTEPLITYADYLVEQEKIGNILPMDKGYYILDYFSTQQTKKTHVSLNHALGEMVFLFQTYQSTEKKDYLNTALAIKDAVESSGLNWIKPENGDFWYQINGDYSYFGFDYPILTLLDILKGIEKYEELNLDYPRELYDQLIESKVNYLYSIDEPLTDKVLELMKSNKYEWLIK